MAESRLAEIYRQELKKKGLLGALVSASGSRLKEKTDIRSILPQSGISGAAFEKMFGKRYKYGSNKDTVREIKGGSDATLSKTIEEKITRLGVDGKITAKNSMSLPVIATQMNLMQKNIAKMVKLSGGTPTTKADSFFKDSKFRENAYEATFNKNNKSTPTNVNDKKESGGFLSSLLGGAKDIVSSFSGFFKGLFGVILASGIIGQFLDDPETRQALKDFFVKFLTGFFEGVKKTFEVIGEALKDPAVQEAIAGAIRAIFNAILEVFKVQLATIETPFGDLKITIGDVVAAFVGFKIAMGLLEAAILMRAANIRSGGPGGADVPDVDRKNPNKGGGTDKNGRKLPQRDPKTGRFMKAAPPTTGKFGGRGPGILGGLMIFEAATGGAISSIIDYDDDRVWAISNDFEKTPYFDNITDDEMGQFLELLEKKKYNEASKYYKSLGAKYGYTLKSKGGVSGFLGAEEWVKSPSPVPVPTPAVDPNVKQPNTSVSKTPSKVEKNSSSSESSGFDYKKLSKKQSEMASLIHSKFMQAGFTDAQATAAVVNAFAESSLNPLAKSPVTDKEASYGLFQMNTKGGLGTGHSPEKLMDPNYNIDLMIKAAKSKAGERFRATTSLDSAVTAFTKDLERPANADAEAVKRVALASALTGSGPLVANSNTVTPSTPAAATAVASAPNTGNALLDIFAGYSQYRDEFMKQSGGNTTNVNAPVTNVAQNSGGGGGSVNPYNTDMMKYLLRPIA